MLVEFRDDDELSALIDTDANLLLLEELVDQFKDSRRAYDIEELLEFLKENGIKFTRLPSEGDHTIIF